MKVAVIISGNVRTWELTRSSFIDQIAKFNPDVFVSTYDLRYGYHPFIQNKIGDSADEIISENIIRKSFDNIRLQSLIYERSTEISDIDINKLDLNMRNIGIATISQIRKINLAANSIKQYELAHDFTYDVIIKTRFDLIYNNIDLDVDLNTNIIFDRGNVYPNDCIYMSSRSNMLDLFEFMQKELYYQTDKNSHINPPHGLLHSAIRSKNLTMNSRHIMAAVIRKNNKIDYY